LSPAISNPCERGAPTNEVLLGTSLSYLPTCASTDFPVSIRSRAHSENRGDLFPCPSHPCRALLPCSGRSIGRCREMSLHGARASVPRAHWDRNCQRVLLDSARFRRWPPRSDSSRDDTNRKSTPIHSRPYRTDHIRSPETSPLERLQ